MKRIDCRDLISQIHRKIEDKVKADPVVRLNDLRTIRETKPRPVLWLIDDDNSIRRAFNRIFEGDSYVVHSAAGASEIEQILTLGAPDLIFLDIGLPWLDGFELARLMKAQNELCKVPIVFISGDDSIQSMKKGFAVGAHDYIKKPFDVALIRKTVKTLLALS